jgi:hypothetical protein
MGNAKAAVFPLPVSAEAKTSRPPNIAGMASSCMAVGNDHPMVVDFQILGDVAS